MRNSNSYPGFGPVPPQYQQAGHLFGGQNYNWFVPSTNKQFVRSLEEALSLPANLNSQNVYFDVNKNIMYDICTNGNGEKSWSILNISLAQSSTAAPAAPAAPAAMNNQTDLFEDRFKKIEAKLEEVINGKYNAKPPNTTNE